MFVAATVVAFFNDTGVNLTVSLESLIDLLLQKLQMSGDLVVHALMVLSVLPRFSNFFESDLLVPNNPLEVLGRLGGISEGVRRDGVRLIFFLQLFIKLS